MVKNYSLFGLLLVFALLVNISVYAQTVIFSENFTSGVGSLTGGVVQDATVVNSGSSGLISKNQEAAITGLNFTQYTSVVITFSYESANMSGSDDFKVYFKDSATGYDILATYTYTTNFTNGNVYNVSFTILASSYNFAGSNEQFKIRNTSGGNSDYLYIDDLVITGYCFTDNACTSGTTRTWNGATWTGGVAPTSIDPAIIAGAYNTSTNGNITCCSLTVNATRTLTIPTGTKVEVQTGITNNGTISIENSGSLIQYYDSSTNSGSGTVTVTRQSDPMLQFDYTYWSSPTSGFPLNSISHRECYTYTGGSWVSASGNMTPGKGYALSTTNTSDVSAVATTASFSGTLNNGTITYAVNSGISTWDLVGNPYPSALDANKFITNTTNSTLINGTIYLWSHFTRADNFANGGGDFTQNDYASYNSLGGVASASGSAVPTGMIASGQGFFVNTINSGNLVFNNCMRSSVAANNADFFKTAESKISEPVMDRFWLDIINKSGPSKQMLIGYKDDATLGFDKFYDGPILEDTKPVVSIFSFVNDDFTDKKLFIQGRPYPTQVEEVIPIGFEITENLESLNKIELPKTFEGVFVNTNIFLVDKLMNVTHNLKSGPYEFTASKGLYNDRFEIKFDNSAFIALNTKEVSHIEDEVSLVFSKNDNNTLKVTSDYYTIKEVTVSNLLGQTIFSKKFNNEDKTVDINMLNASSNVLIIKTRLSNGSEVVKKMVL